MELSVSSKYRHLDESFLHDMQEMAPYIMLSIIICYHIFLKRLRFEDHDINLQVQLLY